MEESVRKKCSYKNSKHKFTCEEPELEDGLCFWHKDVPKDEYSIRDYRKRFPELDKELKKYNFNVGTFLKEKAKDGQNFVDYNLKGANLKASDLTNANLRYINFSGADFRGANLQGAKLCGANLEHTLLSRVNMVGADLRGANLERADVRWSNLNRVLLSGARLEWADMRWCNLMDSNIYNANLCFLNMDHSNLNYVKLSSYKYSPITISKKRGEKYYRFGHYNKQTTFLGVNTNYINWANNRELKRFIIKQQFIHDFIKKSKINKHVWAPLWRVTCDYGNSIFRWLMTACIVVLTFAFLFSLGHGTPPADFNSGLQAHTSGVLPILLVNSAFNWFTPLYFSIVTFTTLGFGDVAPLNLSAQLLVSLEVIFGYFMLGGLLTIFAEKFIIRE